MITVAVVNRAIRGLPAIEDLKAGDPFIRGYHTVEDILSHRAPYSIYFKLPNSVRALGQLPTAGGVAEAQRVVEAKREGRIAFNATKGCCCILDKAEAVIPITIAANVTLLTSSRCS